MISRGILFISLLKVDRLIGHRLFKDVFRFLSDVTVVVFLL